MSGPPSYAPEEGQRTVFHRNYECPHCKARMRTWSYDPDLVLECLTCGVRMPTVPLPDRMGNVAVTPYCPTCKINLSHPDDIANNYCGNCREFLPKEP